MSRRGPYHRRRPADDPFRPVRRLVAAVAALVATVVLVVLGSDDDDDDRDDDHDDGLRAPVVTLLTDRTTHEEPSA